MIRILPFILSFIIASVCISCKKGMPKEVLSESKMKKVLYDYHLAQAMAMQTGDSAMFKQQEYITAVFRRHGITSAEFDSSMVWYTRNTEKLHKIYKEVNERYEATSRSLGGSVSNTSTYASLSAHGDTANVWNDKAFYLLSPTGLTNRLAFTIKTDTSFYINDEFLWHFNAEFVYSEGSRDAIAVFSICYDNDSVISSTKRIMNSGEQFVQIKTSERPIKRIQGFVYLNEKWAPSSKILIISSPSLVRIHNKPIQEGKRQTDSIHSVKDSIGSIATSDTTIKRNNDRSLPSSPEEMKNKPQPQRSIYLK